MENIKIAENPTYLDNGSITSASHIPPYLQNKTESELLAAERERIRAEFFATYDVMTGVRIAATLGGFFGLMVFLIVWKSRSSSNETLRVLKDPKMAAVAAVCMQEEEERELQEAIVATGMSIYPDEYDALEYRRQRMLSLGNVSAPPMLNRGFRFASVGADSLAAAISMGSRRKSGSDSSRMLSNYPMGNSFGTDDYFMESDDELQNGHCMQRMQQDEEIAISKLNEAANCKPLLEVPSISQDSRRSSAMTCCSTESSYLERRCSAFTLGLGNLPPSLNRKLSTTSRTSSNFDTYDYYYPEIQLIQPTPKASPCPSERSLYQQMKKSEWCAEVAKKPTFESTTTSNIGDNFASTTTTLLKANKTNTASSMKMIQPQTNVVAAATSTTTIIPKHSLAVCDPESANFGRRLEIHSISSSEATNVLYYSNELLPYSGNSSSSTSSSNGGKGIDLNKIMCTPSTSNNAQQSISHHNFSNLPIDNTMTFVGNNSKSTAIPNTLSNANAQQQLSQKVMDGSNSISMDSTPMSSDNHMSQDTVSAKTLFNAGKRAPLASLSSFKISSLEYQDYNVRSLEDEDSEFTENIGDTDEDMQQLSSDSDDHENNASHEKIGDRSDNSGKLFLPTHTTINANTSTNTTNINTTVTSEQAITKGTFGMPLLQRQSTQQGIQTTVTLPIETHFGSVICTSNSPRHPRRAQLMQQYSDPHSLPTTTTTTTTTTTDDTCSTLNTEVCGDGGESSYKVFVGDKYDQDIQYEDDDCDGDGDGDGNGGESTAHTQHSSLNTVISMKSISPNAISMSSFTESEKNPDNRQQLQQISGSEIIDDDPSASSLRDLEGMNVNVSMRQPLICLPSSLRKLIKRGGGNTNNSEKTTISIQSALNNMPSPTGTLASTNIPSSVGSSSGSHVLLELPLIRVTTKGDSSESSAILGSDCDDEEDDNNDDDGHGDGDNNDATNDEPTNKKVGRKNKSSQDNDPSLPNSSRKWSKETLF